MPTQNAYTPEVVDLDGGLDFTTPRPSVPPGALIDCLNFEVSDRVGYQRIHGYEAFDGRPSISNIYQNLYYATYTATLSDNLAPGKVISKLTDPIGEYFAMIVSTGVDLDSNPVMVFTVYDFSKFYEWIILQELDFQDDNGDPYTGGHPISYWTSLPANTTNETYLQNLATFYSNLRATIQTAGTIDYTAPAFQLTNPVTGLHWWRDQLYAVSDCYSISYHSGNYQVYPGDYLEDDSWLGAGDYLLVRDISVTSGSFSGGDAAGIILFSIVDGSGLFPYNCTSPDLLGSGPASGQSLTLKRGSISQASALTVNSVASATPPWFANLYRTFNISQLPNVDAQDDNQGWQEIDLGYKFQFKDGTDSGPPNAPGRNSAPTPAEVIATRYNADAISPASSINEGLPSTVAVPSPASLVFGASPAGANVDYQGSSGHPEQSFRTSGSTTNYVVFNTSGGINTISTPILLSGYNFPEIPADAIITGIELKISTFTNGVGTAVHVATAAISTTDSTSAPVTKQTGTIASSSKAAPSTFTLGSSSDVWGITGLTPATINDLEVLVGTKVTTGGTGGQAGFNYVQVIVYYQTSSSIYYFNNGTDDVQAIISNVYLNSGTWLDDDAAGVMQVSQVKAYSTAARQQIHAGDNIYSSPGATGQLIATVASDMQYAGLASLAQLTAAKSQYEIIDANFYANKDWDAIYGVDGVTRAFVYDGFYYRQIFTGLTDGLDNPRHIAFHNFHLCLGYDAGALFTSAAGLPEDFAGLDGAAEFDTGDAITGLLRLSGTALGIFCKRSVQALNGTGNDNFSMSVISPYEGALEYSSVDTVKPMYSSYRGITTLDQTDAYGNFLGRRLSNNVTSWLVPKLTSIPGNVDILNDVGNTTDFLEITTSPLFAMPIRNRNQYKLWFNDGHCLTMTISGQDQTPQFTIQQFSILYNLNTGSLATLVPLAHSSGIDAFGADRNHISYYDPKAGRINRPFPVFEFNRGWGFDEAGPILAYFTTTQNFYDNPFQIFKLAKLRVHGQSQGVATCFVAASADYLSNDFKYGALRGETASNATPQDISLPRSGISNSPGTITIDSQSFTNIADLAKSGRCFAFQFSTLSSSVSDLQIVEPPFILQHMMLQGTVNKADV